MAQQEAKTESNLDFLVEEDAPSGMEDSEAPAQDEDPGYEETEADKGDVAAKAEEKEPEKKADEPEPEKKESKDYSVPKSVHERYVRQVQELRREAQEKEVNHARLEERVKQINEVLQERMRPAPPDPAEDPEGALRHSEQERQIAVQRVQDLEAGNTQATEQQHHAQQVTDYTNQKVQDFIEAQPDYMMAYQHLQNSVIQERLEGGDSMQGAQEYFAQVAASEMERLHRTGGDPAKYVYSNAVKRGYQSSGQTQTTGTKQLDQAKTEKANRSIATTGQGAAVDLESMDIDSMSQGDFDKLMGKLKRQEVPKVFW